MADPNPGTATAPERKKPGRPKKKILTTPVEARGIVNAPSTPGDLVELVYDNPTMFKKLLHLYKLFEVSELELNFDKNKLGIVTKDHLDKSTIYTTIQGAQMNLYYCETPMRICVRRDSLDKVLGLLGKTHYKISIVLKEDYRSTMYMIVRDIEYSNESCYEIAVIYSRQCEPPSGARDDINYPLRFTLATKHFRTLINNVRRLSSTITLQKAGTDPIQFTFAKAQRVNWTCVYNDSQKIDLHSSIAPDDIFSVSVNIDYIRPFSNSAVGDEVTIAASHNNKISFTTILDKRGHHHAAEIKIYTEIKEC